MANLPFIFDQFVTSSEKKRMSDGNRALRRNSGRVILPFLFADNANLNCNIARINRQSSSKSEILDKPISETLIGLLIINMDPVRFRVLGIAYDVKWFYYFIDKIVDYYVKHQRFGGDNLAYQIKLVRWLLLSYVNVAVVRGYYAMVDKAKKDHPDIFVHSNEARYYYWSKCPSEYHKLEDELNINNPTYKACECNRKRSHDIKRVIYDSMDAVRKRDIKDFVSLKNNGVSVSFKEKVQVRIKKKGYGYVGIKTVERGIRSYFEENGITFSEFVERIKSTCDRVKKDKVTFGKVKRVKIVGVKVYDKLSGNEIVDEYGLVALADNVWLPDNGTPFFDDYIGFPFISAN